MTADRMLRGRMRYAGSCCRELLGVRLIDVSVAVIPRFLFTDTKRLTVEAQRRC
jgi:hypothetical protein